MFANLHRQLNDELEMAWGLGTCEMIGVQVNNKAAFYAKKHPHQWNDMEMELAEPEIRDTVRQLIINRQELEMSGSLAVENPQSDAPSLLITRPDPSWSRWSTGNESSDDGYYKPHTYNKSCQQHIYDETWELHADDEFKKRNLENDNELLGLHEESYKRHGNKQNEQLDLIEGIEKVTLDDEIHEQHTEYGGNQQRIMRASKITNLLD